MALLEFDPEVGTLYVKLREGKVSMSEPIADNIVLDLDEKGEIIGLEILLPSTIKDIVKAMTLLSKHAKTRHAQ